MMPKFEQAEAEAREEVKTDVEAETRRSVKEDAERERETQRKSAEWEGR